MIKYKENSAVMFNVMQDLMGLGVSVRDAQGLVIASMDMFWLLWMWLGFA